MGASGSGTTTLGQYLADRLDFGFLDADDFYWIATDPPYQEKRDKSKRLDMIMSSLEEADSAVVSGSIMNWGKALEDAFDLVVFLHLDAAIRIDRLRKREIEELGMVDEEFLSWAADYDSGPAFGRSLQRHEAWLAEGSCRVLRIEGDLTVRERVDRIVTVLPEIG